MDQPQSPVTSRTVLAVVDDLMFRTRISSAAKAAGIRLIVATTPAAAIERVRTEHPDLVLFDLDSGRTQPMDVLTQMRDDAALAMVPTLGFVSHVHAHLIQKARDCGIGRIMARSAFVTELPSLLRGETS